MPLSVSSSLRRRIPALVALVLAVGVGTFGLIAYHVVRNSAMEAADARLRDASGQLASVFAASFAGLRDSARAVATDPALLSRLTGGGATPDAVQEALGRLGSIAGTMRRVELRDSTGTVVAELPGGSTVPTPVRDVSGLTPLFREGDTVYYEISAAVTSGGRPVGSVSSLRTLTTSAEAAHRLAQLIGIESGLLIGNADGTVWTDLVNPVAPPPMDQALYGHVREGRAVRGAVARIENTPVSVAVESTADEILASSHEMAGAFLALAMVVIALGASGGWLLTRPITGSLGRLADTADAIAAGNLQVPAVARGRRDEIGRLARSFDAMATSLRAVLDTLEEQVETRTLELKATVDKLRDAQEELVRKERLATLGQLSSSVGHELRNPLGVMTNGVYFLEHVLSDASPKVKEYLGLLQAQIHLCEKIVSDLLDFARIRPPETTPTSVAELLREQMRRATMPQDLAVRWTVPEDLPLVSVDPVQIGQVLLNLLTNAVQAMEDGDGTLTIAAEADGGRVSVQVADTGSGVAEENRSKIFEPLFTTKARGIGLGLSVSRSLARANGGELALAPEETEGGAVFVLTLPIEAPAGP